MESLPLVVTTGLAAFSAVAVLFLLLGQFKNEYVWPVGIMAAILAALVTVRVSGNVERLGSPRERHICSLLVIAGVLLWVGFNSMYTEQHIFINRDPGFYSVTGGWLIDHDSLRVETSTVFGDIDGIQSPSAGFGLDPSNHHQLDPQGAHLLPALLGLVGRIVGVGPMLHFNVVFGGTALLALYAFACCIMRPRWALITTACMAVSLPLIYFSRDTYTEPLAMTFTFGALALLCAGQLSKRYSLWFLGGMVAGAGVLTRIDAYLTVAALMLFAVVVLSISKKEERKATLAQSGLLLLGMSITSLIGWLDVSQLSTNYYLDSLPQLRMEFILLLAVLAIGIIIVIASWTTQLLSRLDRLTKSWRPIAVACLILLIGIGLAARPLIYTAYTTHAVETANGTVQTVKDRNYSEDTVNWVAWYIGPIITTAGLGGLALAARRAVRSRDLLLVAPLLVTLATSLLYLINPKIARDQIWASRRFLPIVMPGIVVFGGLWLQWLYEQRLLRKWSIDGRILATVLATLAIIAPLFISQPFLFVRERAQQYSALMTACNTLPENAAILWVGTARALLVQPTRTFCHFPSEGYGKTIFTDKITKPTPQTLKEAAKNARQSGHVPIMGILGTEAGAYHFAGPMDFTVSSVFVTTALESTHTTPPRLVTTNQDSILFGVLQTDGTVKPLH